uniref:Uncharacterized protein n=3 Tax=Clytia hemisphaerica TaxID=252671 RepID=A0A7M5X404_9CNID
NDVQSTITTVTDQSTQLLSLVNSLVDSRLNSFFASSQSSSSQLASPVLPSTSQDNVLLSTIATSSSLSSQQDSTPTTNTPPMNSSSALINALLTANNGTLAMGNQNITLSSQPHLAGQNQNTFNFVNNCNNELPAIPAKILKQIKSGRRIQISLSRVLSLPVNCSQLCNGSLGHDLVGLLKDSLAPSTQATYMSGIRSYINFCDSHGLIPFPSSEALLCFFSVFSFNRGIACKTIKVYITGVLHQNSMLGSSLPLALMPILHRVIRGIRRRQGNSLTRRPRKPITTSHLRVISRFLLLCSHPTQDKYMLLAACLTAFFGLLRVSEFSCPSQSRYDPSIHLMKSDVTFNLNHSLMTIRIKGSKTDPFRQGVNIRIAATSNNICPVGAMRNYLALRSSKPGPLFQFHDGKLLTRRTLYALLEQSLPSVSDLNTHSFRIGGASAALSAGASDSMIRIMGRWSSDCYLRYLRVSDFDIQKFTANMAKISHVSSTWDPDKW